jgi:hypothetical protein
MPGATIPSSFVMSMSGLVMNAFFAKLINLIRNPFHDVKKLWL